MSWVCAACTFENTPDASRCEVCEAGRGPWSCAACTFVNQPESAECDVCEAPRPRVPPPPPPQPQPQRTPSPAAVSRLPFAVASPVSRAGASVAPWVCDACTFENPPGAVVCEVCETPRRMSAAASTATVTATATAVATGVWNCGVCTMENASDSTVCEACGASRHASLPVAAARPMAEAMTPAHAFKGASVTANPLPSPPTPSAAAAAVSASATGVTSAIAATAIGVPVASASSEGAQQLSELLSRTSLQKLRPTLDANGVDDLDALRLLTDADFKEMGIALGSRRKLLDAMGRLDPDACASADTLPPTSNPPPPPPPPPPAPTTSTTRTPSRPELAAALAQPTFLDAPLSSVPVDGSDDDAGAGAGAGPDAGRAVGDGDGVQQADAGDFVIVEAASAEPAARSIHGGNGGSSGGCSGATSSSSGAERAVPAAAGAEEPFVQVGTGGEPNGWGQDEADVEGDEKAPLVERSSERNRSTGIGVFKGWGTGGYKPLDAD